MQLHIKNFGPIKEGTLDISKKFDLFVGPNNSGKTYVAQLLWIIFHPLAKKMFVKYLHKKNKLESLHIEPIDNKIEMKDELIQDILKEYSNFLIKYAIPDTFNIRKDHFIVQKCSIEFLLSDKEEIKQTEENTKAIVGGYFKLKGKERIKTKEFEILELEKKKDSLFT